MNWLGLECVKCHKRQKFPSTTMAETCGWCQVNGSWYCYECDFNGAEE